MAFAEDLDGACRQPCPELLADQVVWHRVMVAFQPDMIVGTNRGAAPVGMDERLRRQRLHGRAIERLEKVLTRGAKVTADTGIQTSGFRADGGVEFVEGEELAIAQSRDDPALSKKNRPFDLGLVAWLVRTCRKDGRAVMRRHLGVAAVDLGLVEAGPDHAGLQVVGDHQRRHRAKCSEGAGMSADPIRQRLAPCGLGVGHV